MHHGWDDGALSPDSTILYYGKALLSSPKSLANMRLFMRPGFDHGESLYWYPGAVWDMVTPMENWVEHGNAPNQIEARNGAADFSGNPGPIDRPLCPYPQVAVRINSSLPDPNYANYKCKLVIDFH